MVASGKLLLLERSDSAKKNPRTWGLPGGQRDAGESAYRAALRESREELGDVPIHGVLGEIIVRRRRKEYRVFVARTTRTDLDGWTPDLNEEHRRFRWVDMAWCRKRSKRLHPVVAALVQCRSTRRAVKRALAGAERLDSRGWADIAGARLVLRAA